MQATCNNGYGDMKVFLAEMPNLEITRHSPISPVIVIIDHCP